MLFARREKPSRAFRSARRFYAGAEGPSGVLPFLSDGSVSERRRLRGGRLETGIPPQFSPGVRRFAFYVFFDRKRARFFPLRAMGRRETPQGRRRGKPGKGVIGMFLA
jgi:hypothetical protein